MSVEWGMHLPVANIRWGVCGSQHVITSKAPGVLRIFLNIPLSAIPVAWVSVYQIVSAGRLVSQPFLGGPNSCPKEPVFHTLI